MGMIIQVYEIQTPEEAWKCMNLGVDHIGSVVLSREEWRVPSIKEVIRLSEGTDTRNSLIPLFQEPETIFRTLDYYKPHYVHFCDSLIYQGGQQADMEGLFSMQLGLKQRFPEIGIMRSVPIPRNGDSADFPTLSLARMLEPVSDIFLTDTWLGKEPVQGFIGITGETSDWRIARALVTQSNIPVILAGGLSPENVYRALTEVLPQGADTCTRTNSVDAKGRTVRFKKDFKRVEAFIKEVRRAEKDIRSVAGRA